METETDFDYPGVARCQLCDTGVDVFDAHAREFGRVLCGDCCHHEARRSSGACCETFEN